MIDLADIKKGMKVYDLGSGDGRLLLEAAKKGADAIGYEINPFLVLFTKLRILISPYRNKISVFRTNFWHSDIKNANVVFIYLIPWEMEKLEKFLVDNLRKNTIVVSNSFIFPNLKLIKSSPKHHIYLFRI